MAGEINYGGRVSSTPSSTSKCGVVLPPGAEPSTPEIGGLWYDDVSDCLAYFNKSNIGVYLPNANGNAGEVLTSNGDALPTWKVLPGDVDLSVGGSDKQLQVNNASAFGGISNGNADEVLVSNGAATFPSFKVFGKVLYGAIAPTTEGVNDDFYIDTATNTLYGPKAGGVWPEGTSLIGPTGSTGAKGDTGSTGATGTGFVITDARVNQTAAVVTTLQTLCAFSALGAGALNALKRKMKLSFKGLLTTAHSETPALTFDIYMLNSKAQLVTGSFDQDLTQTPFELEFEFQTSATGATGALVRSARGKFKLNGTTITEYIVVPTTDTTPFDLTANLSPILTVTASGTALTLAMITDGSLTVIS